MTRCSSSPSASALVGLEGSRSVSLAHVGCTAGVAIISAIHATTAIATPTMRPATNCSLLLHPSSHDTTRPVSLTHSPAVTPLTPLGNGHAISLAVRNPQHCSASWIRRTLSSSLARKSSVHRSRSAQPSPPTGEMCVPERVAMTVL